MTELRKEKQGIAIALSLLENDKAQISEVFDRIPIDDLKEDDGLDTLIAFLDDHHKKDDIADGLEKFEEFEDFQQKLDMSITEYIASFDSRYRKIERLKMVLTSEILAFKPLKKANISKEEKMLVLTGMNYANKNTYMRRQRFKGSIAEGQDGLSSGIKLEPAFLAEHQEALLAAGYVKQFGGGKTGRWGKCNSNSDRHHGQA